MELSLLRGFAKTIRGAWQRIAALALVAAAIAAPAHASAACAGTLSGSYGLLVSGATTSGVSKFLTGVLNFNSGTCAVTGDITVGEAYAASPFGPIYAGSYATNADGSITLSLTLQQGGTPELYAIGYSSAFSEAVGAEMDKSAVAIIDLKPQAAPGAMTPTSYSNASIQGAFVSSCSGITATYTDLNNFTFDGTTTNGVGNITTGIDYYNNYGQSGVEPYAGQYTVNADGTFTGYVIVAGMQYGVTGVIDNGGNEVQFLYSAKYGDITACSAKRAVAPQAPAKWFACHVGYVVTAQTTGTFSGAVTVSNTGTIGLSTWSVAWSFANGQTVSAVTNASVKQKGSAVTLTGTGTNASLAAGANAVQMTLSGKWNNVTNAAPTAFAVNGVACN